MSVVRLLVSAFCALFLALSLPTNIKAQQPPPPPELKSVLKLAGTFDLVATLTLPDGTVIHGKGTSVGKVVAGGNGVATEVSIELDGMGRMEESDLWSFDQWTKQFHLYSLTSMGAVHDHAGTMSKNTLRFHWKGLSEGKKATEEIEVTWVSDTEMHLRQTETLDGKPNGTFEVVAQKH